MTMHEALDKAMRRDSTDDALATLRDGGIAMANEDSMSQAIHVLAYYRNDTRITAITPQLPFYFPIPPVGDFSRAASATHSEQQVVRRGTISQFGGPDLDRLYVTSAKIDLDESALAMQPKAGGLFMLTPGVRGLADVPYDG